MFPVATGLDTNHPNIFKLSSTSAQAHLWSVSKHSLSISNLLFPNLATAGMQPCLFPGRSCQTQPCNSPTCWLFLFLLFYWSVLQNAGSLSPSFLLSNSTCFSRNGIYRQFIEIYNDTLHAIDFPCLHNPASPMPKHRFHRKQKIFFLL